MYLPFHVPRLQWPDHCGYYTPRLPAMQPVGSSATSSALRWPERAGGSERIVLRFADCRSTIQTCDGPVEFSVFILNFYKFVTEHVDVVQIGGINIASLTDFGQSAVKEPPESRSQGRSQSCGKDIASICIKESIYLRFYDLQLNLLRVSSSLPARPPSPPVHRSPPVRSRPQKRTLFLYPSHQAHDWQVPASHGTLG